MSSWLLFSNLAEIKIVLQYVRTGALIEDLLSRNIFYFNNNMLLSEKADPFDLTIVWAIHMPNDPHFDLWSKHSIKNEWIKYQENQNIQQKNKKDVCYITGEKTYLTDAYPKISGNTKLISSNDEEGLTFLGRFFTDKQAIALGRDVSQKAFNMLKWLIKRQGIKNGDQITVAWAISDKVLPSPMHDHFDDLDVENLDINTVKNKEELQSTPQSGVDWSVNIGQAAATIIKKKLYGYQAELKAHDQISLLMLDSATPGRMALTYYQEFLSADYFANLNAWIDDFAWYQRYKPANNKPWLFVPPSPELIARTVLSKFELEDKKKKAKKQLYARLLPVIAGGNSIQIPYDLVQKSFQIACNPFAQHQGKDSEKIRKENWKRNISVACALYKGWRARHYNSSQRRTYSMSLDIKNNSRNYLYGRLLAIAENIESYALYLSGEKRATTAERYIQRFAEHPFATWKIIELALSPYKIRLRNNQKDNGVQAISEVMNLFNPSDYTSDEKLDGEFLLGYHCQKIEIDKQIAERKAAKEKKSETNK